MSAGELLLHEKYCVHQEVHCFDKTQCSYVGPFNKLYKHIKERRCIQIITDSTWNKPAKNDSKTNSEVTYKFNHCLNDFPEESVSVFNRTSTTSWKTIVLLAKDTIPACLHLLIQRSMRGMWSLMVSSKLPTDHLHLFKAKVIVGNNVEQYSFTTQVLGTETSKEKAIEGGSYLSLTDAQVLKLSRACSEGRKLFDYEIVITPDMNFVNRLNSCIEQGHYARMNEDVAGICYNELPSDLEQALDEAPALAPGVASALEIGTI